MYIIKIIYSTKQNFVEQNKKNIQAVMDVLLELNSPNLNYFVCLGDDGKTFIHTAFFNEKDNQKILFDLLEFQHFQNELKSSGLESAPKQELLTLVGSSKLILG